MGNGVAQPLFRRGRQTENFCWGNSLGGNLNVGDGSIALGQGSRLVKDDAIDFCQHFDRPAAADVNPSPGSVG